MSTREWDVVLFGATGFTGALTAEYLAKHAPAELKLALAGRSRDKLEAVKQGLGPAGARFGVLVADVSTPASLAAVAASTKVLVTTVGPYAKYGLPVVEACAKAGTHCCDLTGEPQFMRRSIDGYDALAKSTGARIVHTCGFDSIPSDLGLLVLHDFAKAQGLSGQFKRATLAVLGAKGGFSGGTIASMVNGIEEATADRSLRKLFADPYALSPDRANEPDLGRQRDQTGLEKDDFLGTWTAPFVMASINTRVVRRSNALLGYPYGKELRYRETTSLKGVQGLIFGGVMTVGLGAVVASQLFGPTKKLVGALLPKPGEGPDKATRESGYFKIRIEAESVEGERLHARVVGTADPGYGETAKMLSEAALCLALDEAKLPKVAGVLTPATAMGLVLVERLRAAGMTFEAKRGAR
ncbi:MAG: saccharopine dehydrogenase NADP-binding domain-containing protein [Myxococcaceae bacterium]|nr:saccharopine dehydrogenase NADP-binding domain-containing protein [Myxococcaceae bacterium]